MLDEDEDDGEAEEGGAEEAGFHGGGAEGALRRDEQVSLVDGERTVLRLLDKTAGVYNLEGIGLDSENQAIINIFVEALPPAAVEANDTGDTVADGGTGDTTDTTVGEGTDGTVTTSTSCSTRSLLPSLPSPLPMYSSCSAPRASAWVRTSTTLRASDIGGSWFHTLPVRLPHHLAAEDRRLRRLGFSVRSERPGRGGLRHAVTLARKTER